MQYPNWAALSCRDCQRYRLRDGRPVVDLEGNRVETARPIRCDQAPCGSRDAKPNWRPEWYSIYQKYMMWKTLKALPRSGGMDAQDKPIMQLFLAIAMVEREVESKVRSDVVRKAGPLGAVAVIANELRGVMQQ